MTAWNNNGDWSLTIVKKLINNSLKMKFFTFVVDTVKFYVQIFLDHYISVEFHYFKVLLYVNKSVGCCLRELKIKRKGQLCKPKSGCGRLQEWLLTRAFHYKV